MLDGNASCACPAPDKGRSKKSQYPLLSTLLIALLPKCPFCITAFTSAVTVCSTKPMLEFTLQWTSWISITLGVITLGAVALNFKGRKTMIACLIIIAGILLIARSELVTGQINMYYAGAVLLLTGGWINGNFSWFMRLLFKRPAPQVSNG